MGLPSSVDVKIREQFTTLIKDGPGLVSTMKAENRQSRSEPKTVMGRPVLDLTGTEYHSQGMAFEAYRTQAISLLRLVLSKTDRMQQITADFRGLPQRSSSVEFITGTLIGLQKDYEAGLLDDLSIMIEAEIASDYMGQAEHLLGEGVPGQNDYVPAAVLAGAVLEDALRRLCERQEPPISTRKDDGEPKKLVILVDGLKAAGLFNELKAKQPRAWADIRNAAAHGRFDEFKRSDVEAMLKGVRDFLADYL
ncbi:MAG: DUF4145 domain-containing protein [Chloroflexi bacterium]|nr:DUF4145 domain-containing protein [Chloroflexota bacterium]